MQEKLPLPVRAVRFVRRYGPVRAFLRLGGKIYDRFFNRYESIWPRIRADEAELRRQRETPVHAGLISLIVPVYNTDPALLHALVDSLIAQTYPDWEAVFFDDCSPNALTFPLLQGEAERDARIRVYRGEKNAGISGSSNSALALARGEWVALLDHDDLLTPDALYRMAEVIAEGKADLIYSDEDKVGPAGETHFDPHFKPDFCPDNLRSGNYICHFMAVRKSLMDEVGGFRSAFNGSQDHDLTLRCIEKTDRVAHIPRVLYQWRMVENSVSHAQLQKCVNASMRAVEEHMARIGWPGKVVSSDENEGIMRLQYEIRGEPLVSVILCGEKGAENCRQSIHTDYKNIEFITIRSENRFAAMNKAAKEAKGDVLLFIDPSAAAKKGDLVTELLMYAQRDDVGAVTPVIWDRRGCISHGGFAVGMKGGAICREEGLSVLVGGWHLLMCKTHNVSAVSAACLMVRKDHFIPFDERFREGLGAVDWCLRMQKAGYRHVFTPHASLVCQNHALLLSGSRRDKADLALFTSIHGERVHDSCYSEFFARNIATGRVRRDLEKADLRAR